MKNPAPRTARTRRSPPRRTVLRWEWGFWEQGMEIVAGVDEVGRGPLAGPVVAAAVVLPREQVVKGAQDSKTLTAERREVLAAEIMRRALHVGVGAASAREIDRINIRRATALAMQRAVRRLGVVPDHLLVDGLPVVELGIDRHTAVVQGDGLVHCIGCASIVAKVVRDRLMTRLALRHPAFGWERNKGYATADHLHALELHGPTAHHRKTFRPAQLALDLGELGG